MWNTFLETTSKDKVQAQLRIIDCLVNVNENVKTLLLSSGYAYHISYILKQ